MNEKKNILRKTLNIFKKIHDRHETFACINLFKENKTRKYEGTKSNPYNMLKKNL